MKALIGSLILTIVFCLSPALAMAGSSTGGKGNGLGFLAAAIAVGASSLGAGLAVAVVGSAAMGAISERPELAGRAIIFLGLAEGIAIYGLIVAIMILARL
ncbi:ATP synthase subunit C [Thermosulfuriphilus sp.]